MKLKDYIKSVIYDTLKRNNYNQVKAAKELQISRNTLRKYMPDLKYKRELYWDDKGGIKIRKVEIDE